MEPDLICWKCGGPIKNLPMPLGRLSECKACHAELHVCRLCEFFDQHIADQCREPVADFVKEKERANFCDYFIPKPDAYTPKENSGAQTARSELDALFGLDSGHDTETKSGTDEAREKLDQLFGSGSGRDD